ncbi:LacI family DNA-binding transcriptional regulator [Jiella sonneratiae]|uniref:LacI family DNA-binding transcriptional regulator n=1 Tax=Jiella sonneratiae TaxID=2816856 RepID=A0ABS3J261_9HYPH|nr:LacI family DNA-binding transcriptional regulator [Jiella sonneratiae]MBO0903767.1 LacI family DNA-binding transcriptional regulator [Jiella sonneratiae]
MAKKTAGRRSTIYDIAVAAKTSPATVSLVLNGSWERYRINADTARRVMRAAKSVGYAANLQARGLRLSRSGLAGMIIPHYRNRFFAGLAEAFEAEARGRGLTPIVVSTQRQPETERSVTETLIAQQVDCLIIAGVDRPDELNARCDAAGVACVNLDLPGPGAPSVVTDNRGGAHELTARLVDCVLARGGDPAAIAFIGGREAEFATDERVAGFEQALAERGFPAEPGRVLRCGYQPRAARTVFVERIAQGSVPPGVFINSITAFEGLVTHLRQEGFASAGRMVLACFDWDPFAASLPLPVLMMRQNVEELISRCFEVIDERPAETQAPIVVKPTLAVVPRDIEPAPVSEPS